MFGDGVEIAKETLNFESLFGSFLKDRSVLTIVEDNALVRFYVFGTEYFSILTD